MSKIEWTTDRHGSHYAKLGRILTLSVHYEMGEQGKPHLTPYRADVFGATLTRRFATAEEAKEIAIKVAHAEVLKAAACFADEVIP